MGYIPWIINTSELFHIQGYHSQCFDVECLWFFASLYSQGQVCECKVFQVRCTLQSIMWDTKGWGIIKKRNSVEAAVALANVGVLYYLLDCLSKCDTSVLFENIWSCMMKYLPPQSDYFMTDWFFWQAWMARQEQLIRKLIPSYFHSHMAWWFDMTPVGRPIPLEWLPSEAHQPDLCDRHQDQAGHQGRQAPWSPQRWVLPQEEAA